MGACQHRSVNAYTNKDMKMCNMVTLSVRNLGLHHLRSIDQYASGKRQRVHLQHVGCLRWELGHGEEIR